MNQNIKETCIMRMYICKNVENVTQIKIRITECKIQENIMSMKKVILGILVHAFMKMTNI